MEQHQILAVMVQLVLCKASYHCSWQVKLSEMVGSVKFISWYGHDIVINQMYRGSCC